VEEYQDSKLTTLRTCPEEKHEEFKRDSVRKVCDGILSPKDLEQKLKGFCEYFYTEIGNICMYFLRCRLILLCFYSKEYPETCKCISYNMS
jgi:hypothetical protein